uniref:Tetraspanin n=1 Tax=Xiphophorus couchianus TaxID=32473 RepID=A0A3B5MTU8_9TELE
MALPSGIKCLKYLIFIFNFIYIVLTEVCNVCQLAGTAVLAIGLWLKLDSKTNSLFQGEDSPYVLYTGVYVMIAVGALMMVMGFLGCCGAIQESPLMLGLFFSFLLIIFAIEIAAGFWGFSYQNKYLFKTHRLIRLHCTMLSVCFQLNCCGLKGRMGETYPDLCPPAENLDMFIIKSCPDAIDEVFNSKLHIVGGIGITIGVIMVFGLIFTMLLCCAIRKSREVV